MKIKKCYIENFGKLHEFKYEFSDGLNIINEMNGWGKSTLATFIKVMFLQSFPYSQLNIQNIPSNICNNTVRK